MSCREQSAADLNVVASEHARDWLGVPPFVTASGGALALGVFSSTIRSYENGTVLKRQFWLRGLFVEILVAAPLPPGRGLWPLGRVEERVAFLTRRGQWPDHIVMFLFGNSIFRLRTRFEYL